jgi:hypothetical protein
MLILGEVRTCLLHNSGPLSRAATVELLELVPGRRVLATDRPVNRSVSPESVAGVDCRLATPQSRARGIGTVASHAVVTGGLVLQGLARARLVHVRSDQRRPWSHYAERPGVVEVIGKADNGQLADGYRAAATAGPTLDLGAISEHVLDVVQMRPQLDHVTAIRSRPTRLRWTAVTSDSAPAVKLHIGADMVRTVELTVGPDQLGLAERFCADLALHDWLITTVGNVIEQVDREGGRIDVLAAAVERLVHLWMPGAHVDPAMCGLWDALERRPGFSLQWQAQISRIRDLLAIRTLKALERVSHAETSW